MHWHPYYTFTEGSQVPAVPDAIRNFSLREWKRWKRADLDELLETGALPVELRDEADGAVRAAERAAAGLATGRLEAGRALLAAMEAREAYEQAYRDAYHEAYTSSVVAELWKEDMRKLRRRRAAAILLLH